MTIYSVRNVIATSLRLQTLLATQLQIITQQIQTVQWVFVIFLINMLTNNTETSYFASVVWCISQLYPVSKFMLILPWISENQLYMVHILYINQMNTL
jgi:hypothetical protein